MALYQADVVGHYADNILLADELIRRWQHARSHLQNRVESWQEQEAQARLDLARAYLLTLDVEALDRVEKLTGYRGFTRRDPIRAMLHEQVVLERTIAQIQQDERWIRRQYLVGPEGEYIRERAETAGMLEPWVEECDRFERLDGFLELVEVGYDTDGFVEWWYQPKYWKHWAAGDRICADLEMADFGDDVLPAYEKVRVPREQWRAQLAAVDAKIDAVHELVRRRDHDEARIPQLPAIYLDSCHQVLAEFFQNADLGLLEEWIQTGDGDRGVMQVLRRSAGLAAKIRFGREALNAIEGQIMELEQRRLKFVRKQAKFARAKHAHQRFNQSALDTKFGAKADKYRSKPQKLAAQLERVDRFDDYGSFDLSNDPELWWVTMTGKRPSGLTPGLHSWYARHPELLPVLDDDEDGIDDAVIAAAGAFDRTDRGYLS